MGRIASLALCCALMAGAQEKTPERERALALIAQGKYADAEPLLLRALEAREKELRPEDPQLVPAVEELAALERAQGNNADAEKLYLRSLQLRETAGTDSADLIPGLKLLASLYVSM